MPRFESGQGYHPSPSHIIAIRREGDNGLFVSTGDFTNEVSSEAKTSDRYIKIMNVKRFTDLWKTHYADLPEEDKTLLPLRKFCAFQIELKWLGVSWGIKI